MNRRPAASELDAVRRALEDPERFPAPPGLAARIDRALDAASGNRAGRKRRGFRAEWRLAAIAMAAIAVAVSIRIPRREPAGRPSTLPLDAAVRPSSPPLIAAALRLHRERLRGSLSFDLCDRSPERIQRWVCAEAGLETPEPALPTGGEACAAIVEAAGEPAAVLAYERGAEPVTLLTARRRAAAAPARFRDPATGAILATWQRDGQQYVLVAGAGDSRAR